MDVLYIIVIILNKKVLVKEHIYIYIYIISLCNAIVFYGFGWQCIQHESTFTNFTLTSRQTQLEDEFLPTHHATDSFPQHAILPHTEMPFGRNHSTEAVGRVGSGSSTGSHRGVPLNIHGMAMSKYCYECGTKFPVPQAKYCCECGTKRI